MTLHRHMQQTEVNTSTYDAIAEIEDDRTLRLAQQERPWIGRIIEQYLVDSPSAIGQQRMAVGLGCGPAQDAEFFYYRRFRYVSVDCSPVMIE